MIEKLCATCEHHWSAHHRKRRKNSWKLTKQETCYEPNCKCKKFKELKKGEDLIK